MLRYLWPRVGAGLSVAVAPVAARWIRGAVTAAACALGFLAGGLNLISCRTGRTAPSPAFQTAALSEAYPRAAPGLRSLSASPASVNLHLTGDRSDAVDVWVPGVARPQITASGLTEVRLTAQPDSGWRLAARAVGQYTLAVR